VLLSAFDMFLHERRKLLVSEFDECVREMMTLRCRSEWNEDEEQVKGGRMTSMALSCLNRGFDCTVSPYGRTYSKHCVCGTV
jgi:hypothetical protein